MERRKRYKKWSEVSKVNQYIKREFTSDKVVHYFLYPVVPSTINGSNDFLFHVLQLCWNDKNLQNDRRYRQLLTGMRLKQAVPTKDLAIAESGWFKSSRQNDLAEIGKIVGYFLRMFAYSIGEALYDEDGFDEHSPVADEEFNNFVESLKLERVIVPVVVKLHISQQSSFDTTRFVCVSEDLVKMLTDGDEISASLRSKVIKIKNGFYDWAWQLLNMRTVDERLQWLNDKTPFKERDPGLETVSSTETSKADIGNQQNIGKRLVSQRMKYPNKLYSSEIYEKN